MIIDLHIVVPDPNLTGNYKITMMAFFKGIDEYFCTNIFAEIYRT